MRKRIITFNHIIPFVVMSGTNYECWADINGTAIKTDIYKALKTIYKDDISYYGIHCSNDLGNGNITRKKIAKRKRIKMELYVDNINANFQVIEYNPMAYNMYYKLIAFQIEQFGFIKNRLLFKGNSISIKDKETLL